MKAENINLHVPHKITDHGHSHWLLIIFLVIVLLLCTGYGAYGI